MTLSSRHRIRNSSPGGLRPSTLPLGHGGSLQYWLSHVDGEETFLFLSNRRDREPSPELANHYLRAPARSRNSWLRRLWWFQIEKTLWSLWLIQTNFSAVRVNGIIKPYCIIMSPLYRGGRYIALLLTTHLDHHVVFDATQLNRSKSLKNKQKTATKHTGNLECRYPESFIAE